MKRYMLDTDTCSYIMKRSHPSIRARLEGVRVAEVCVSVITKAELLYGVEMSSRRNQDAVAVEAFLRHTEVLDFPEEAAANYARIRADLKRRGQLIGANDLLIAAHAQAVGAVLVTNNTSQFGRVEGIALENWAE